MAGEAYPGATTYPGKGGDLSLGPLNTTSLGLDGVGSLSGFYPGSYPGSTSYPGHGSDLGVSIVPSRTLTAVPA